jgi:hypothetical protein
LMVPVVFEALTFESPVHDEVAITTRARTGVPIETREKRRKGRTTCRRDS